jgi:[ribosomal protein S5]-alanine N-acetyltransferase
VDGTGCHPTWPSSIPDLATERLRLRAPLPRDAAAILALIGDPEVTKYINVATIATLAEAQAVEHSEMIGTVGLLRFDFEHRHAELGYDIARRWWGRGLVEAGVLPENDASVRVLQKLGFVEEGMRRDYLYAKGRFHSFRWFSLLSTDGAGGSTLD